MARLAAGAALPSRWLSSRAAISTARAQGFDTASGLLNPRQPPAAPASVDRTSVRWKFWKLRLAVGPRCLVSVEVRARTVGVLDRRARADEAQLPDLHTRPELDRQGRDVGELERDVPGEAGVDESGGRMREQSGRPSRLLPSRRAATSLGSVTSSKVEPSTNSPGCRMNGSLHPPRPGGSGRAWSSVDR